MQTLIIADGSNQKIGEPLACLQESEYKPQLIHILDHCRSAGLNTFTVITGKNRRDVESFCGLYQEKDPKISFSFIHNPYYEQFEDGFCLSLIQPLLSHPLLLIQSSIIPSTEQISALLEQAPENSYLIAGNQIHLIKWLNTSEILTADFSRFFNTSIQEILIQDPTFNSPPPTKSVEHPLDRITIIEPKALHGLKSSLKTHASIERPLIIADENTLPLGKEPLLNQYPHASFFSARHNTHTQSNAAKLAAPAGCDAVMGFGGGRPIDIGKHVAQALSVPFISIPTSPAHDGIASKIAILKDEHGKSESIPLEAAPAAVIIDLDIIQNAPKESVLSGTGDLLSNISSIADWRLGAKEKGEAFDETIARSAENSANTLLNYLQNGGEINDPEYLQLLITGLLESSDAMNAAGSSRPASGAEHKISHAIDMVFPERSGSHGLQVALGVLIAEQMRGNQIEALKTIYMRIGLPTTFQDLGFSQEEAIKILEQAPQTRPGRYTILEHKNLSQDELAKLITYF